MVEYIWDALPEYPDLLTNDLCCVKRKQMWICAVSYLHFLPTTGGGGGGVREGYQMISNF